MQFIIPKIYVHFFIALITFGCNNGDDKNTTRNTLPPDSIKTKGVTDTVAKGRNFGGNLDTLWMTAESFKKLDKKNAIFIFRFDNNDTETLDGWKGKGSNDSFNILPDVRFIKGNTDAVLTYGPGTYFGNIGLRNIDKIQKKINDSSATHVIFVPAKFQEHVYYKVFLSKEPHTLARKTLALIPVDDNTNPSPPKQYN